jgi:hypothetical protein
MFMQRAMISLPGCAWCDLSKHNPGFPSSWCHLRAWLLSRMQSPPPGLGLPCTYLGERLHGFAAKNFDRHARTECRSPLHLQIVETGFRSIRGLTGCALRVRLVRQEEARVPYRAEDYGAGDVNEQQGHANRSLFGGGKQFLPPFLMFGHTGCPAKSILDMRYADLSIP